jgi:hypothetical protein
LAACASSDAPAVTDGGQDAGQLAPDSGKPDSGSADAGSDGGTDAGAFVIQGRLIDKYESPSTGLVALDGRFDQAVTVGADGQFVLDAGAPPYDLAVYTGSRLIDLRGLSTASPVVRTDTSGAGRWLGISGQITGLPGSLGPNEYIMLSLTAAATGVTTNSDGSFAFSLSWFVPGDELQSDLVALHVDRGPPLSLEATGALTNLTWSVGTNQQGLDFPVSTPVPTLDTTVSVAPGAYGQSKSLRLRDVTLRGATFFLFESVSAGDVSVPRADAGSARFAYTGWDLDQNKASMIKTGVPGGTTELSLPATVSLRALAPADGATGLGRGPTLTWTPVDAPLIEVRVLDPANANRLVYDAFLPGGISQLTLYSSPEQGIGLLADHAYAWSVYAWDRADFTPDGIARHDGWVDPTWYVPTDGALELQTGSQTFTTGP